MEHPDPTFTAAVLELGPSATADDIHEMMRRLDAERHEWKVRLGEGAKDGP